MTEGRGLPAFGGSEDRSLTELTEFTENDLVMPCPSAVLPSAALRTMQDKRAAVTDDHHPFASLTRDTEDAESMYFYEFR
ncbi:hypothetical protein D3OALGA1CA_235 [Olavius algarvensis associated proteobacterium Delta 3]|nr:hypothetical protein D3OALGA1CA_235 [Olavius algarvensis associated proteobacterium Delta 3]